MHKQKLPKSAQASSFELKDMKNKKGSKQDWKQVATKMNKVGNKVTKAKPKGKCFHCGEAHWLRNCQKYLALKCHGKSSFLQLKHF
jgi:hypothetical protein